MTHLPGQPEASQPTGSKRVLVAWCLYDWANSAYPTVVLTFVFAAYFTGAVATDPQQGTAVWGQTLSLSALLVALISPLLGAIADHSKRRKPWLAGFTLLCIAASAALWQIRPEPGFIVLALALVFLGNASFEFGQVFYNAMLPDLAPQRQLGRISGWAWATGYAGGLSALGLCLVFFALPDVPLFGLDKAGFEHVRITGPLTALWFALFALPLFLWVPDGAAPAMPFATAIKRGYGSLIDTLKQLRAHRTILRFLLARMIYNDGLTTLFAFGGIYAAGSFGMDFQEILVFGLILNVTSGLGAAGFAWVDDWIGSKPTITIAVAALIVLGTAVLLVESKTWFYILGAGLGIFVGPAQAASRSLMARLAPEELRTEMFGLYAFSGKATAFAGPALVGWVTVAADSQRWGMATILVFFVLGLLLLQGVREPGR